MKKIFLLALAMIAVASISYAVIYASSILKFNSSLLHDEASNKLKLKALLGL